MRLLVTTGHWTTKEPTSTPKKKKLTTLENISKPFQAKSILTNGADNEWRVLFRSELKHVHLVTRGMLTEKKKALAVL